MVQRISQEVATSYANEDQVLTVGSSIGIAMFPQDGLTSETLLKNADSAMYEAKASNKGGFTFFT